MTALLDAALEYAASGLPVFPCVPRGKEPAVKRGFYAATTNPETIRRYWRIADRNIGIPTGASSGLWIFDVDQKDADGEASLRGLEAEHGALPATREVITGGAGRHLWFKYTGPVPCSASRIAPGIDVRGDGGYVIAPPSIHESGRSYAWSVDSADTLAIAPDWLIDLARKRPEPTIAERALGFVRRPAGSSDAYGQAALDREIAILAATAPGSRNHALNRCAFRLFQLVAGGELDGRQVSARLIEACRHNGLVKDDGIRSVVMTIRSGANAGMRYPRSRGAA